MGGAVLLLLHRKKPEFWDGAVLVAPMCKVFSFSHASNLYNLPNLFHGFAIMFRYVFVIRNIGYVCKDDLYLF